MDTLLKIGIIGDFDVSRPSQVKTGESLVHVSRELSVDIDTVWLPTAVKGNRKLTEKLSDMDAVWAGPGDYEDPGAAILAIKHCREQQKPFFGRRCLHNRGGHIP
jgi:CTP synthase (UTP-ammonia lyase)